MSMIFRSPGEREPNDCAGAGRAVRSTAILRTAGSGRILLFCLLLLALSGTDGYTQDWRLSAGYSWEFYSLDYMANRNYGGTIPITRKGNIEVELERYLLYRLYIAGKADYLLHNQQSILGGGPIDFGRASVGAVLGLQWEQWGVYGGVRAGRMWDLQIRAETADGSASWIPSENGEDRWTTAITGGVKYYLLNFIRLEANLTANNNLPEALLPVSGTPDIPALNRADFNPYTFSLGVSITIPWNSKKRLRRINDRSRLPPMINPRSVSFDSPMQRQTQVTSAFGPRGRGSRHEGVDLDADRGDNIVAAEKGVVIKAGKGTGYGKMVKIRHDGGFFTLYAHLSRIKVREGEKVKKGEVIGKAGNTGQSRGIHLHFEILENNRPVNPQLYVRF